MAKLSVITCVYNTDAKLFEESLNSLFCSTLKDIEVIVVDDGGEEDYSKLIKKYHGIKYIKSEHQGTLAARILGVKSATSPYVYYLDSDDTISFDYLEALLARIEETGADMVINDWAFHSGNSKYICKKDTTISRNFILQDDLIYKRFFRAFGIEHSYYTLWNKIVKKDLMLNAIQEIEKLSVKSLTFAEDMLITYFLFKNSKMVANVHLGYYFYRIHDENECGENSPEKLKNHILESALVFDLIENDLKASGLYDSVSYKFEMWKMIRCDSYRTKIKSMKCTELLQVLKDSYKIEKIKHIERKGNSVYASHKLLPDNLTKIDEELKKIYYSNKYLKVYANSDSYAFTSLVGFKRYFNKRLDIVKDKKSADVVVSNEIYSLKKKILHNSFINRIGMFLIPKGSRLRKKLKAKI